MKKICVVVLFVFSGLVTAQNVLSCDPGPCDVETGICQPAPSEYVGSYFRCADYSDNSAICWGGSVYNNCDGTMTSTVASVTVYCPNGASEPCGARDSGFWPVQTTFPHP